MNATSLLYNLLVLCSAFLAVGLIGYTIRRDGAPAGRIFALFMLAIVDRHIIGKPFQIEIDLPADLPCAQADTLWLRRALMHLLSHTISSSQERRIAGFGGGEATPEEFFLAGLGHIRGRDRLKMDSGGSATLHTSGQDGRSPRFIAPTPANDRRRCCR